MKRTKNSRKMHMVFNVQSGTVEVKLHENEFTVHRGGIWQVPRGELYMFSSLFVLSLLCALRNIHISSSLGRRASWHSKLQVHLLQSASSSKFLQHPSLNASTRVEML
jgi:hypothetical protein